MTFGKPERITLVEWRFAPKMICTRPGQRWQPLPNATVWEETKTTRVTYHGDDQRKFSVIVRQKPNPIGFHAKLPGDRRK